MKELGFNKLKYRKRKGKLSFSKYLEQTHPMAGSSITTLKLLLLAATSFSEQDLATV